MSQLLADAAAAAAAAAAADAAADAAAAAAAAAVAVTVAACGNVQQCGHNITSTSIITGRVTTSAQHQQHQQLEQPQH